MVHLGFLALLNCKKTAAAVGRADDSGSPACEGSRLKVERLVRKVFGRTRITDPAAGAGETGNMSFVIKKGHFDSSSFSLSGAG